MASPAPSSRAEVVRPLEVDRVDLVGRDEVVDRDPAVLLAAAACEVLVGHAGRTRRFADLVALDDLVGGHGLVVDLADLDVADAAAVGLVQLVEAKILLG